MGAGVMRERDELLLPDIVEGARVNAGRCAISKFNPQFCGPGQSRLVDVGCAFRADESSSKQEPSTPLSKPQKREVKSRPDDATRHGQP